MDGCWLRERARHGRIDASRMRRALLATLLLLVVPAPAGAVTLLVNGDTPSTRWQAAVDRSLVSTPIGPVTLWLTPCPETYEEGVAAECVDTEASPPDLWLAPDVAPTMRESLFHGLGHIFEARYLNSADRERFRQIWRRPAIGWWDELAPFDPDVIALGPTGLLGGPSAAAEWFADSYAWCATHRVQNLRKHPLAILALDDLGYLADAIGGDWAAAAEGYRRLVRSCRVIHSATERARI